MSLIAALILAASPAAHPAPGACGLERREIAHEAERPHRLCEHAQRREQVAEPRTVRLDQAFFHARNAGGVGREPAIYGPVRRLVIVAGHDQPRSAGAEAARRGLGPTAPAH